jgi:hypothetical protein
VAYYRTRYRRHLGDVPSPTAVALPDSTLSQDQYNQQMLSVAQQQYAFIQKFNQQYVLHGWLQLAATLSIPLAGAAWKWLLGRRKAFMSL